MDVARLQALKKSLETQIREADGSVLDRYPLDRYLHLIEQYPRVISYEYISTEVSRFCDGVLVNSSARVLELYNQHLLIALIEKASRSNLGGMTLPDEMRGFYALNFERIAGEIEQGGVAGFYLYPKDKFLKDLGLCSLKLIPAGSQKLDLSPLPLGFLFKNGAAQFISGIRLILFELKGVAPLYHVHTDSHDPHLMSQFTAEGWRRTYIRIGEMLSLHPEVKGIFGRTWFIDPQLEKISPKLCYVRHLNLQNGARFFFLEPSTQGIEDAVYKSARRRQLYEKGEYVPHDYLGIWPRNHLIAFSRRQKNLDEESIKKYQSLYA